MRSFRCVFLFLHRYLWLVFGFLSILSIGLSVRTLAASASDTPISPASPYTTTFSYTPLVPYGIPLAQVTLNNQMTLTNSVTATFGIDTGTNVSEITRALALRLGLTPKPYIQDGKPFTRLGKLVDVVALPMLKIGDLTIPNIPIVVMDDDRLSKLAGRPIDGFLGANVLNVFAVAFDFPRHQITLFTPGSLPESLLTKNGFDPASALPLTTPPDDFRYSVPVRFRNGTHTGQESLLVDTGSAETNVSSSLAQQLGLVANESHQNSTLERAFDVATAPVASMQLGPIEVSDHSVTYLSHKTTGYLPPLVGMDVLGGYRVLMDFPAKKMYLAPAISVTPPIHVGPPVTAPPSGPDEGQ